MKKMKTYKNVHEFATKGMEIDEYDAWLINFKNRLIEIIITTRKSAGLTQVELAEMMGTTQSVMSRIESGRSRNITIDYLLKVISVLGVSPNQTLKQAA